MQQGRPSPGRFAQLHSASFENVVKGSGDDGVTEHGGMLYVIEASLRAKGVVEVRDVLGTLYGQTAGLLPGSGNLDGLREEGKVGAINVSLDSRGGATEGTVRVHTRASARETAEIAAALETVDKVGPCEAEIEVDGIELSREGRRLAAEGRARELLEGLVEKVEGASRGG